MCLVLSVLKNNGDSYGDHELDSAADTYRLQILIVDDMVAVRDLLKYMLEKKGHIVRLADSGQQALLALK